MKIGIDLDNTIIDYDQLFSSLSGIEGGKKAVKAALAPKEWNALQTRVYGSELQYAEIFPGCLEFFDWAKKEEIQIEILSHKTKVSNFDGETPLHEPALQFLRYYPQFDGIPVHFFETRQEKVAAIDTHDCDLFLDDLEEVLKDEFFPKKVFGIQMHRETNFKKLLRILEEFNLNEVRYLKENFGELPQKIVQLPSTNSRVFKLSFDIYPPIICKKGERMELLTEYEVCERLDIGVDGLIPKPLGMVETTGLYFYSRLEGLKKDGSSITTEHLDQMVDFIVSLSRIYQKEMGRGFPQASMNCLTYNDYLKNIENRILAFDLDLEKIDEAMALAVEATGSFLKDCADERIDIFEPFPREELILSPSDFGPHNMLFDGPTVRFFDFEYFGIDDPAKLCADFLFHLGHQLSEGDRKYFVKRLCARLPHGERIYQRTQRILKLVAAEWVLIALNVFNQKTLERKIAASPLIDIGALKEQRLDSARELSSNLRSLL